MKKMKRLMTGIMIIVCLLVSACATMPSSYHGIKPDKTIDDTDGSITYEFYFSPDDFDEHLAGQQIREYFVFIETQKGFTSFDVLYAKIDTIQRTNKRIAVANALGAYGNAKSAYGGEQGTYVPRDTSQTVVRFIAQIMYKK
jgi:hypothetical protein